MSDGEHLGITVFVNRYDGIDLPDEACRLLIIDGGVACFFGGYRQREMNALLDSPIHHKYIAQTLEQGMGRGIRSSSDYCAILLMGQEPAVSIRKQTRKELYSPVLQKQIDLSNQVTAIMKATPSSSIEQIRQTLIQFINRDPNLIKPAKQIIANANYAQQENPSELATARRKAFGLAMQGDIDNACASLNNAINAIDNIKAKGWFMEELAGYKAHQNSLDAKKILESARQKMVMLSA